MTLAVDEFIRRFLIHVLPDGFHRIRHYGLFANGGRAESIARARQLLNDQASARFAARGGEPLTKPAATRRGGTVRCAIYTRKSSEEGLEQEFNSLQAQREAGEAFIASQRHEGWACLATRYDDGGLSGATIDRPALQRLLADIAAGRRPSVSAV
jgi:Putative transposase/Resolvase, N terminal domain